MEYKFDLFTLLGLGISSIAFFLSLFFIFQKKFKNDGYYFLYVSIIILGFELFYKVSIHSRLIYDFSVLYIPRRFYNLLIYPVFLYFIWSITKVGFKMKIIHKSLLLFFVIYGVYVFVTGQFISLNEKLEMLNSFYKDMRPGPFNYWLNSKTLVKSIIIPLPFLSIMVYDFFRFKKRNVNIQSKRLVHILSVIIVFYFLYNLFSNVMYKWIYNVTKYSMIEWPIDIAFLSIIITLLSIITLLVNTGSTFFPPLKYSGSALDKSHYESIISKAKKYIEHNELYKKDKGTLNELSKGLNINSKYLSQAINHHLKLSFVDFLNNYRVEEAKKQLLNKENASLTLEAIGLMAGFKSKSAFFRAFKKATNITPNQFVKSKNSSNS
ncbi:helix-turn-helix domain-containing protein [Flavobacteriaceae bacterium AU392]|nr:AraC family transcriptional regulator [Flavobacteriaceae bacterium]RKM82922.1 helix-turn-helix domain-containing protein [Flavobacteriaceae bacterium AU392]